MTQGEKNVLIVELNEFNVELLTVAVEKHSLPSLAKMLAMPRSTYKTTDRYNSGYLEPWVQWVSIHAGVASSKHRVKHLGDVPDLNFPQCWEVLSEQGITSGVWGVMNGARNQSSLVKFFLPDPWTFTEWALPAKLNHLLDLPRYISKNYQELKISKMMGKAFALLKMLLFSGVFRPILKETISLLKNVSKKGKKHYLFISYFDAISTMLFSEYKKKFNPRCSFLFLNSLAHLQHHYWTDGTEGVTPEILYGLKVLDTVFENLFKTFPDDAFVIHNGLSQMNTNHEKAWVLYRQKDPKTFLNALNIFPIRVEQHMTHDGHAFFSTALERDQAIQTLKAIRVEKRLLFLIEAHPHDECKLFYQLQFTDDLEPNAVFTYEDKTLPFFKYFDRIVTRTGRHIPIGTVFSDTLTFPDHIFNHDFNKYLYHYLMPSSFHLREKIEEAIFSDPELQPDLQPDLQPESESISA